MSGRKNILTIILTQLLEITASIIGVGGGDVNLQKQVLWYTIIS